MDWNDVRGTAPNFAGYASAAAARDVLRAAWKSAPVSAMTTCSRSERAAGIRSARDIAEQWRRAVLAKGSFIEV